MLLHSAQQSPLFPSHLFLVFFFASPSLLSCFPFCISLLASSSFLSALSLFLSGGQAEPIKNWELRSLISTLSSSILLQRSFLNVPIRFYLVCPCTIIHSFYFSMLFFLETPGSWHLRSGEEKAFQFYNSCMDTDTIESAGAGPLQQVIEEVRRTGVSAFLSNSYDQGKLADCHDFLGCRSLSQGLQVLGGRQK